MVSTYGIFLFRQSCLIVPNEMLDAARLDGCSELGIYFRVVMPLVRPMAAAFCLVAFLANWNAFFTPNIFLHSEDNLTVPVVLNLLLGTSGLPGRFLAGTALTMIPPAVLFFALQKEFISGLKNLRARSKAERRSDSENGWGNPSTTSVDFSSFHYDIASGSGVNFAPSPQ